MATTRSLKDAAKDPLVEKKNAITQKEGKEHVRKKCVWKVVAAVIVGLVGGFVSSQFLKIRL
jgi:hypothetical protein